MLPFRIELGGDVVLWLVRSSVRKAVVVLLVWLCLVAVASLGVLRLAVDNSATNFLGQGSESWKTYQRSIDSFGGDEFVAVAFEAADPFSLDGLRRVKALQSELEGIEGVRRVDSLASVPLIREGPGGELRIDGAIERGVPSDQAVLAALRTAVSRDLIAPGGLISTDERTFALNVVLDGNVTADRTSVVSRIRAVAGDAWVSGVPVFRTQINADTLRETLLFIPITSGAILALLLFFFRSSACALLPLGIGGLGAIASVSCLAWTGTPLSLSTMILPPIMLALGSAYAMHVVAAASDAGSLAELETSLEGVATPVALSGLTTTLGFLAMSTTSTRAIQEMALFGAPGVLVLTVGSLTALPAVLSLLARRGRFPGGTPSFSRDWAPFFSRLAVERRGAVILCWAAFAFFSVLGLANLNVSSDLIRWYSPEAPVRAEYNEIRDRLAGISPVNVVIDAPHGDVVTDPLALRAIYGLARELENRPDVGKALSLADPMRLMQRELSPAGDALPQTREEVEQYLLVLESAEQLSDVVTADRSSANILLRVDDNQSSSIAEVSTHAATWWRSNGLHGYTMSTTGIMYEFASEQDGIVETQFLGLSGAVLSIGVVLWLVVGSARLAAFALLPNLVPIAGAYGLMGFAGIPLDAGTACLGSLALGIGVDDTVHVALGIGSRVRDGIPVEEAVRGCLSQVMQPLVVSSLAIAIGFSVLGMSELVLIRNLGLVTVAVVLLCWSADVTLLPALLVGSSSRTKRYSDGSGSVERPTLGRTSRMRK